MLSVGLMMTTIVPTEGLVFKYNGNIYKFAYKSITNLLCQHCSYKSNNRFDVFLMKHLDENGLSYWEHWWRTYETKWSTFYSKFLFDVLSDYGGHNE